MCCFFNCAAINFFLRPSPSSSSTLCRSCDHRRGSNYFLNVIHHSRPENLTDHPPSVGVEYPRAAWCDVSSSRLRFETSSISGEDWRALLDDLRLLTFSRLPHVMSELRTFCEPMSCRSLRSRTSNSRLGRDAGTRSERARSRLHGGAR